MTENECNIDVNQHGNVMNLGEQKMSCDNNIHWDNNVPLEIADTKDRDKENCPSDNIMETKNSAIDNHERITCENISLTGKTNPFSEITTKVNLVEGQNKIHLCKSSFRTINECYICKGVAVLLYCNGKRKKNMKKRRI
ncbi:hypothetical protein JTB14_037294 [Gonioctena quinquepunctata]|nr:hypothetical protein JTB14_037294 [Gonioctena quinquepunctata]